MNRNDLFTAMEGIDEKLIERSQVNNAAKYHGRFSKRTLLLAAALCLVIVFAGVAVATRLISLRSALVETVDPEIKSQIVLSGFTESDEYKAAAEWKVFEDGYDPDGVILAQVDPEGPEDAALDAKYDHYSVYTQEMADKLDRVAAKYGLKLYGSVVPDGVYAITEKLIVNDTAEYSDAAYNTMLAGYLFDCGTFAYDGIFDAAFGRLSVDYQFRRSVKGVLDPIFLNIGDIDSYQEQTIMTDSGIELAAGLTEDKAVLVTEFDSCFISINVMGGTDMGITFDDLKDLANTFDFNVVK